MIEIGVISRASTSAAAARAGCVVAAFRASAPFRPHILNRWPLSLEAGPLAWRGEISLAHQGVLFLDELRRIFDLMKQRTHGGIIDALRD